MHRRIRSSLFIAVFASACTVAFSACATAHGPIDRVERGHGAALARTVSHARSNGAMTASEIERLDIEGSLLDAIQRLRPEILLGVRGLSIAAPDGVPPMLYVDGVARRELSDLQLIPARIVARVEFLRPSQTGARIGREHAGGAIVVTLRGDP